MDPVAQAPRLTAYLASELGGRVHTVPRSQHDSLQINSTQLVAIDTEATPVAGVESDGALIASVAAQGSKGDVRVSIYRHDPKDAPTEVNVDHYTVLTNLASNPRLAEIANAASTSLNPNLTQHLQNNVFWVKEDKGDDHWLAEVPSSVMAVVRIESD